MKEKVIIIAEAGVNHNGNYENAQKLLLVGAEAGVDYVKFQTFKADKLVSKGAEKAEYQKANTDDGVASQFEMLKKLEMPYEWHIDLIKYAKSLGVKFLSTGFDEESIDFLDKINIDFYKIPSGEITNKPFLEHVAKKKKPIIISTGMAKLDEVRSAIDVLKYNGISNENITILHCNTEYPTPMSDVNLRAILSLKNEFDVKVGYSDHVENNYACLASVALGAEIVEKHFTLDKNMEGPDHSSSLEPNQFKELVFGIRNIELALGSGLKIPTNAEIGNSNGMKRSLVAITNIKKGDKIKAEQIGFKRPFNGLSPNMFPDILGKEALKDIERDEPIQYNSVKW